jgi:hypothetical protein
LCSTTAATVVLGFQIIAPFYHVCFGNRLPLAGLKLIQRPVTNRNPNKTQGRVTDSGGHSANLTVATFADGEFQPLCGYGLALTYGRRTWPDWWRVDKPDFSRPGGAIF